MVRRWSHINQLTSNFFFKNSFFLLKKKYKFINFKSSVSLKRFNKKYTKLKRKALSRIKHLSNWTLYHNIFKYWCVDYLLFKKINKFQYLQNIFLNNFFFYNFFSNNKKISNLNAWNFLFITAPRKIKNLYFAPRVNHFYNSFLHEQLSSFKTLLPSYLSSDDNLENNNYCIPLFKTNFNSYFLPYSSTQEISLTSSFYFHNIFSNIESINFNLLMKYYQIIIIILTQ